MRFLGEIKSSIHENQLNQHATDVAMSFSNKLVVSGSSDHPTLAAPAVFLFLFSQFRVTSEKSASIKLWLTGATTTPRMLIAF